VGFEENRNFLVFGGSAIQCKSRPVVTDKSTHARIEVFKAILTRSQVLWDVTL
jgi:hypothetical protein